MIAARFGLDLSQHHASKLTEDLIDAADLVLVAEADHLFSVVDLRQSAFQKTFMYLEFAERAGRRRDDEPLESWIARAHHGRTPNEVIRYAAEFGLSDPYKRGKRKIGDTLNRILDGTRSITDRWSGVESVLAL